MECLGALTVGVVVGVLLSRFWCWFVRRHFPEDWQW